MPITSLKKRKFTPSKKLKVTQDSFRKGLDVNLRASELGPEQARETTNMVLDGKGILKDRPGTGVMYAASSMGKIRGLYGSKINDTVELLATSDEGYLTKMAGASYTRINGASWASGYKVRMTQLKNQVWITSQDKPLTRYDGTTLLSYTTLAAPTALTATNISGVTGTYSWSWRVAARTDVGRTLASDPIVLSGLPEDLTTTAVQISWTAPSAASGVLQGYEIFGREMGSETRLTGIPSNSTTWIDNGATEPSQLAFLPDFNETGGPQAKYIIKSAGKLIIANISGFKSRVMWSGADNNLGKFHWTKGGGYLDISGDDGQEITGIKEYSDNQIIIAKERSIYQMKLSYNSSLGIVEATTIKLSDSVGCVNGDTIQAVNNATYFAARVSGSGITIGSLDYEPNIYSPILRTADLSPQIKPLFNSVNTTRLEDMFAVSWNQKYWLFYPVGAGEMQAVSYDWQRGGITGPHTFPSNPCVGTIYYDADDAEHFIYGDGDDGYITEISESYGNDKGTDFGWQFASRKENFKLPFSLKTLLQALIHLADIKGSAVSVEVLVEKPDGTTTTTASFTVATPNTLAGFGSFMFGAKKWGSSDQASTSTSNTSDIRKYLDLNATDVVSAQIRIGGSGTSCKILSTELRAREQVSLPTSWLAS